MNYFTTADQVDVCRDCGMSSVWEPWAMTGVDERGYWALCVGCQTTVLATRGGDTVSNIHPPSLPRAGQRQLKLDDDQLLALAKLLHTMTERNMLAFTGDREYQAYIGAVARVDAAAEDVINESRAGRRIPVPGGLVTTVDPLKPAEVAEFRARWAAVRTSHDSTTGEKR